jgi:hypothetical protein
VEGVLFYNGIAIQITKPAAGGIASLNWTQKFLFPWDVDFKADEARLENGELYLVFKASSIAQKRVFKFPPHFSMNASDAVTDSEPSSDDLPLISGMNVPMISGMRAMNLTMNVQRMMARNLQTAIMHVGQGPMARSTASAPACLYPVRKNHGAGWRNRIRTTVPESQPQESDHGALEQMSEVGRDASSAPGAIGGKAENEFASVEGGSLGSSWNLFE